MPSQTVIPAAVLSRSGYPASGAVARKRSRSLRCRSPRRDRGRDQARPDTGPVAAVIDLRVFHHAGTRERPFTKTPFRRLDGGVDMENPMIWEYLVETARTGQDALRQSSVR